MKFKLKFAQGCFHLIHLCNQQAADIASAEAPVALPLPCLSQTSPPAAAETINMGTPG
jgi:hypothetical protein